MLVLYLVQVELAYLRMGGREPTSGEHERKGKESHQPNTLHHNYEPD